MTRERSRISIVIPSRDNASRLALTLGSIERSRFELGQVEVVVVDDGSSDGTHQRFSQAQYPYRLKVVRGDYANQSLATNEGIRHSTGEIVLLSASDIVFHEDLISEHLSWHERFSGEKLAVLGNLPYLPTLEITPFMFYLVNGGFQFAYFLIRDPLRVAPNFTYAPNFSIARERIDEVGDFDPQFPFGCQDTDFGIRLSLGGTRIVYNDKAIGYHNHPMEMRNYFRRQVLAGEAAVRLQAKHPDHEQDSRIWDSLLISYLGYPRVQYEADELRIATLEHEITASHREYQALWTRAFVSPEPASEFSESQRSVIKKLDDLFNAYGRILMYHWSEGYLTASIAHMGSESVEARLNARLDRCQISTQCRQVVDRKLQALGLRSRMPCSDRDFLHSRVVYGLESYEQTLAYLQVFLQRSTAMANQQLLLVVEEDRFSSDELGKLEEAAHLLRCTDIGSGILQAIRSASADIITVTSAAVPVPGTVAHRLSELIFSRFPKAAALSGSVIEADAGTLRCGYRFDSGVADWRPLLHSGQTASGLTHVDAANPEYFVIRRSAAREILDHSPEIDPGVAGGWNFHLCRQLSDHGQMTFHVPELGAGAQPASGQAG